MEALHNIITNNALCNRKVFIVGDANIDLTALDASISIDYMNMLHFLNFLPIITEPTRYPTGNLSRHRPSTIDHIFFNQIVQASGEVMIESVAIKLLNFWSRICLLTKCTYSIRFNMCAILILSSLILNITTNFHHNGLINIA